jgi:hypothetical protein
MNKLWNTVLLLLLLCASVVSASNYNDTVFVRASGQYGEKSSIIVVRGCSEHRVDVPEHISSFESEDNLLARAYGSEPLEDSSEIYYGWAADCDFQSSQLGEAWEFVFVGGIYGVPATALGAYLLLRDYDYNSTSAFGHIFGIFFAASGGIMLTIAVIALPMGIASLFDGSFDKAKDYRKKAESWKLRVAPTINFNEPGGGILLQFGF